MRFTKMGAGERRMTCGEHGTLKKIYNILYVKMGKGVSTTTWTHMLTTNKTHGDTTTAKDTIPGVARGWGCDSRQK
jgi:hypothetical protein